MVLSSWKTVQLEDSSSPACAFYNVEEGGIKQ